MAATNNDGTMVKVFEYTVNLIETIGRGAFGTVHKGLDKDDRVVAVKKVPTMTKEDRRKASGETMKFYCLREKLGQNKQNENGSHENIIQIYDVKYFREAMWIMMEFCDLGDLNRFFRTHEHMLRNKKTRVKLMLQIAKGIAFLHFRGVAHRDIKPDNIMVKSTQSGFAVIKLGDFGLVKILDADAQTSAMTSNVGTRQFKAPEFWRDPIRYHRSTDIYAEGLTFTAMLQNTNPQRSLVPKAEGSLEQSEKNLEIGRAAHLRQLKKQADFNVVEDIPADTEMSRNVKRLIRKMTHVSPKIRPTACQVENILGNMP